MSSVWKLHIETPKKGGSWKYYSEMPTPGEIVDYILSSRSCASFEHLLELAVKYIKRVREDKESGHHVTVNFGALLDPIVSVSVYPSTLHSSLGTDTHRMIAKALYEQAQHRSSHNDIPITEAIQEILRDHRHNSQDTLGDTEDIETCEGIERELRYSQFCGRRAVDLHDEPVAAI